MHHLPRFFSNSKRTKGMDPKKTATKPRLERRNAAKHIDYNASSSSSSLESSPSPSLHTRSLDLSDRTSFRVQGTEGEFDLIYRSLGLSGPDDFAISKEAWEARKVRSSSDIFPRSRILSFEENSPKKEENSEVAAELCDRVLEVAVIRDVPESVIRDVPESVIRDVPESTRSAPAESSGCCTPSGGVVGGGIKGVRPPLLKPPPSMRLPEIDKTTSTWDLFKDFGPIDEINSSTRVIEENSSDDEEELPEEEEQEVKEDKKEVYKQIVQEQEKDSEARLVVVENEPPSETCSFTTSNDDDASSSTTEPSSNISPNGRFKRNITSWQKGDLLGRGSFGSVYEGIAEDGFFFAVKEVSLLDEGSQGKQSINQLEQEIALLSQFEHENIVQYYGTETDESKLYIFLELVTKGSLQNLYQKYILRDTQVSAYTRQILQGLKYLHDRNVVHRDIKCANILVDASGSVKLADFGLAKATTKLNDVKSCKGTAFWMAPEVVNRKNQGYGLPADIWSLGCTVLEMLTQKIPYSDLEGMQALFRIGKGVPPSVPDSLSNDARDFIWKCLQVNPDARATAAGLLNHSFVKRPLPTSSGSASPFLLGARSC